MEKTYRIIDKANTSEEYLRNYLDFDVVALDGVVVFSDKTRDGIFLANVPPFQDWKIGDYIEIDLDATRRYSWSWNFDDTNIVRKVGSSALVSRNNASVNQASETIIQVLNRAIDSDERNKYTASVEVDPKTGNVFYHLSGQRK